MVFSDGVYAAVIRANSRQEVQPLRRWQSSLRRSAFQQEAGRRRSEVAKKTTESGSVVTCKVLQTRDDGAQVVTSRGKGCN
jgi:hypothetical protein